jgi:hypothetical protein
VGEGPDFAKKLAQGGRLVAVCAGPTSLGIALAKGEGMAAVAQREDFADRFVGKVLARSSPVLTWRPALVAKAAQEAAAAEAEIEDVVDDPESSVQRISRLPTTRMVVWPVVRRVQSAASPVTRPSVRRTVVTALAAVVLVGLGLTAHALNAPGVAAMAPPPAKVTTTRALDDSLDAVVGPAPAAADVAAVAPSATPAKSANAPRKTAASPARATSHGHARHAKHRLSPAIH